MASKVKNLKEKKRRQRKRVQKRDEIRKSSSYSPELSSEMNRQLLLACELIEDRELSEAKEILLEPDSREGDYVEVIDALVALYQEMGDHERCCTASMRWAVLKPNNPEARIMYAQESMFCGRAALALLNYQHFIEQWPEHEHVIKAKASIEILIPEVEARIEDAGFPKHEGVVLQSLHEESLVLLKGKQFPACIQKCKALLAKFPHFSSSRNNLAIAYFHEGQHDDGIAVLKETKRLFPDNRFTDAMLAKQLFLNGQFDLANELADQIVQDPPENEDAMLATLEMLAFLGRDEDILKVGYPMVNDQEDLVQEHNNPTRAYRYHLLAYAESRLGAQKTARQLWNSALDQSKNHFHASENLEDLQSQTGHSPWANTLSEWCPEKTLKKIASDITSDTFQASKGSIAVYQSLVPAMLDRGDPNCREMAVRFALLVDTPEMLEALKEYALSNRGPDESRQKVLVELLQKDFIDKGPHRILRKNEWIELELVNQRISFQQQKSGSSDKVIDLISDGIDAMNAGNLTAAEQVFEKVLVEEPNNLSATYNLCGTWFLKDDLGYYEKAMDALNQLHEDHPDYFHASIALAQIAIRDNDIEKAEELLYPITQAPELHASEASALYIAQASIAIEKKDAEVAEGFYRQLLHVAEEDAPQVLMLRSRIDSITFQGGIRKLLSNWAF